MIHTIEITENRVPTLHPLQIALIALLPKDGQKRTVAFLAGATEISAQRVTAALMDPYMSGMVDFDVLTDSYSLPGARPTGERI